MRAAVLLLVCVAAAVAAPPAQAQPGGCPLSACALASFPALAPSVLAGGREGVTLLAGMTGLDVAQLPLVELSAPLTAEQEALLGCGPYWGTVCERDGIDLRGAEGSVLMQSWVGPRGALLFDGGYLPLPGARSPFLPGSVPSYPVGQFPSEMAALSWNLQLLLVAFSSGSTGTPGSDPNAFDPNDPYAQYDPNDPSTAPSAGKCSFVQPQYCSAVQTFFDIVQPAPQDTGSGGNTRFGRRDRTNARRMRGCLASARGLASPSSPVGSRGWSGNGRHRAGRCPAR